MNWRDAVSKPLTFEAFTTGMRLGAARGPVTSAGVMDDEDCWWLETEADEAVGVAKMGRRFALLLRPSASPYEVPMTRAEMRELRALIDSALGPS